MQYISKKLFRLLLLLLLLIIFIYNLIQSIKKNVESNNIENVIVKNEIIRLGVVLSLAENSAHITEFNLLYESWRFIQNFSPLSNEVLIDLIVFCEQPSCYQLPASCLPLSLKKPFDITSKCYYEELAVSIVKEWQTYLYMTSIAFMLTKEYIKSITDYQWILRVDQDAVLSPALFFALKNKHPIKLYDMQFGGIGHGDDFTHNRLRQIAKKLGYNHYGIHNLCSTWLVRPQDSIILANLTTIIGKHFVKHEFGKNVSGIENLPDIGEWPKWWRGVISLYAADIAINHFYSTKLGHEHESTAIDHPADSGSSIWNAWQIHCLHDEAQFSKFKHRDQLNEFLKDQKHIRIEKILKKNSTQNVLNDVLKEFYFIQTNNAAINGTVTVRDYVFALAWQKAYAATGAINLN